MQNLAKLSKPELNKLVGTAQAELKRRSNLQAAAKSIRRTMTKYSLSVMDLHEMFPLKSGSADHKLKGSKRSRSPAKPKFLDPASGNKWSGRGRAPRWVNEIIKTENISLEAFKSDERFLIKG